MARLPPIFFAWTRSFWMSVAGIALVVFGAPPDVMRGLAWGLATVLPWSEADITRGLVTAAPAVLWALALHQRSGAARPYTVDPRALK